MKLGLSVVMTTEQARRAYLEALKKENGNRDFAASVGRVEQRLAEYRQLASQRAI